MTLHLLRYGIAVPNELMQYALVPPLLANPVQSNVPLWPRLGWNKRHRRFGGDRARKPAGGDPEVRLRYQIRTLRGWAISVLQDAGAIHECEEHG
jgi:hypothetical protein